MSASHLPYDIRKKDNTKTPTCSLVCKELLDLQNVQEHQSKNELACENTFEWAQKSNSLRAMGRLCTINVNDII